MSKTCLTPLQSYTYFNFYSLLVLLLCILQISFPQDGRVLNYGNCSYMCSAVQTSVCQHLYCWWPPSLGLLFSTSFLLIAPLSPKFLPRCRKHKVIEWQYLETYALMTNIQADFNTRQHMESFHSCRDN